MSEFELAMLELEILKVRLADAYRLPNNRDNVEVLLARLVHIEDAYL